MGFEQVSNTETEQVEEEGLKQGTGWEGLAGNPVSGKDGLDQEGGRDPWQYSGQDPSLSLLRSWVRS